MSSNTLSRRGEPNAAFHWERPGSYVPYLFIAPLLILLAIFTFYPYLTGAQMSLTDAQGINAGEWVGFANFSELFQNIDFLKSLLHTFMFLIGCFITQIPVAFILAYILNNVTRRLRGTLRAAFFFPVLINSVLVALMWRTLSNKDVGAINWFLGLVHLPNNLDWTHTADLCVPLMVMAAFWQWTGYTMVYFLAQLQTIDVSIYESARLDGASSFRVLRSIIMPMMRPAFIFVLVTSGIGCLMQFEYPFLMFDNGGYGPDRAAQTAVCFIYWQGWSQQFRLGFATAASWVLFAIVLIFSLAQIKIMGLGESNES